MRRDAPSYSEACVSVDQGPPAGAPSRALQRASACGGARFVKACHPLSLFYVFSLAGPSVGPAVRLGLTDVLR